MMGASLFLIRGKIFPMIIEEFSARLLFSMSSLMMITFSASATIIIKTS
jgi:hypothetical protein